VLGTLADLERIYTTRQFTQVLVAIETLPRERMEQLWQFANTRQLTMQRFSIRLNDLGPSVDSRTSESAGPIITERPSATGIA
jgi:hypothetical protein